MSRIDQAFRRAASGRLEPSSTAPEPAAGATLDTYTAEQPTVARIVVSESAGGRRVAEGGQDQRRWTKAEPAQPTREAPFSRLDPRLAGKLVVSPEMPAVSVEQYRRLAALLRQGQSENGLKTLMVTSALPAEGKTLTISNIALTLSESYSRRVLLVDADLRRPTIHEVFSLPNSTGLSEALRAGGQPAIREVSPRLSVLPAGRVDGAATAALSSERLKHILETSGAHFDWVLMDTPPVAMLSDAQIVSGLTDGVLFVIRAGSTPYAVVQRAISALGADRVIGTVLNRVDEKMMPLPGYYESYYGESATGTGQ